MRQAGRLVNGAAPPMPSVEQFDAAVPVLANPLNQHSKAEVAVSAVRADIGIAVASLPAFQPLAKT